MPDRALIRPPRLNTGQSRTASRLELFFDLAYVLVVAGLATSFAKNLTWHGAGVFAGLFTIMWFSWVGFTLYANRFDTDDVVFRGIKLASMLAIGGCAASAAEAGGALSGTFAACYLLARVLLLVLHVRAWVHVPQARGTISVYLVAISLTCLMWASSLALDGPARYVMWAAAVVVDGAAPVVVTLRGDSAPLHMGHLPERFGLLVILVLGEGVAGAVAAVVDTTWAPASVTTAAIGFVAFAALWWNYFDSGAEAGQENLQRAEQLAKDSADDGDQVTPATATPPSTGVDPTEVSRREDWYIYGHLPLTLGIAVAAVGLEELALHPTAEPASAGLVLAGGVFFYFAGLVGVVAGSAGSLHRAWPWPMVGTAAAVAVVLIPQSGQGAVLIAAVLAVGLAAAGTVAHRNRQLTVPAGRTDRPG